MPRLRRAAARGRELNYTQAISLLDGHDFMDPWESPGDRHDAWLSVRDEWLPEFIAVAPTTRPAAWWDYCSTGPRKCVSGPGNFAFRDPNAPEWTRTLWFGAPSTLAYDDFKNPSVYETQLSYLARLSLLTLEEVAWLDALAASSDPTYRQPEFDTREWWEQRQGRYD